MTDQNLKNYLESVTKFTQGRSYESVVLEHGRSYAPPVRPRPKGIRKQRARRCFQWAYHYADEHDWKYVEGFARCKIVPFPVHHAWCIDKDGNIVETVWPESGLEYFGIEFEMDFIHKVMLDTKMYGIITSLSRTFCDKYFSQKKVR